MEIKDLIELAQGAEDLPETRPKWLRSFIAGTPEIAPGYDTLISVTSAGPKDAILDSSLFLLEGPGAVLVKPILKSQGLPVLEFHRALHSPTAPPGQR